jgi:protein-tyrosine phosphatase
MARIWRASDAPSPADASAITRVLIVCTANICRSPMAEGVARHMAQQAGFADAFEFDSAGTRAVGLGGAPDPRVKAALERRGYALMRRRPRRLVEQDFERFDLMLAMDHDNLADMARDCPPAHAHKLRLFLDFAPGFEGQEVPDPYYGNAEGFDRVLDLCEAGMRGLLLDPRTPGERYPA